MNAFLLELFRAYVKAASPHPASPEHWDNDHNLLSLWNGLLPAERAGWVALSDKAISLGSIH